MSALRQREPRYENRALLDLCYQIPCTADWPHDCGPSEPAHSNQAKHGKGKSLKAHDCFVAAICRNAHRELDQGKLFDRDTKEVYWQRAFEKTLLEMWRRNLLKPDGFSSYCGADVITIDPSSVLNMAVEYVGGGGWGAKPRKRKSSVASPAKCRIGSA